MSNTIYGTPVGTPISPKKIEEVVKPVKTVNGQAPDAKGNVETKGIARYNPVSKTDDMTQPVGVDAEGRLWVAPIGGGSGSDTPVLPGSHCIVWDLVNVTSSSNAVSIHDGMALVAVLTANDGYTLGDVTVTMGGEVLTGVWNPDTATITIMSVAGDVVISCAATQGVDTTAVIAQYGVGLTVDGGVVEQTETCITDFYDIPEGYTDKINGVFPAGDKWSTSASNLQIFNDDVFKTYWSETSLLRDLGSGEVSQNLYYISAWPANKVRFVLYTAYVDDSYLYFTGTGDIIFAGKNTPYYGLANIDGTKVGQSADASTLSLDDDIAMNYKVATASIMGEDLAINTNVVYGISQDFANVIVNAKKEWMTEYAGDYRKIPIIVSTDQHGRRSEGIFNLIGKTFSMHDISKVMNLGDTISEWGDSDPEHPLLSNSGLEAWCESVKAIPFSKQLNVFGNHDTWYGNHADEGNPIGTRYPSSQTHLYQYFRNIYARRTNNNGWFVDYDDAFNVKYVVVSGFEYQNGSSVWRIGTEQMKFVIDELSKSDGYDIVIVSHVPLRVDPSQMTLPTGDVYNDSVYCVSALDTDAFFAARKNKESGTIVDSDGVEHDYDFSGCETELLCSLHGHTHEDVYLYLNDNLLVNAFDWFDDSTFFLALIDRVNRQLNVWKIEATGGVPSYQNYQIPFDKPTE